MFNDVKTSTVRYAGATYEVKGSITMASDGKKYEGSVMAKHTGEEEEEIIEKFLHSLKEVK